MGDNRLLFHQHVLYYGGYFSEGDYILYEQL